MEQLGFVNSMLARDSFLSSAADSLDLSATAHNLLAGQ